MRLLWYSSPRCAEFGIGKHGQVIRSGDAMLNAVMGHRVLVLIVASDLSRHLLSSNPFLLLQVTPDNKASPCRVPVDLSERNSGRAGEAKSIQGIQRDT